MTTRDDIPIIVAQGRLALLGLAPLDSAHALEILSVQLHQAVYLLKLVLGELGQHTRLLRTAQLLQQMHHGGQHMLCEGQ